MLGNEHEFKLFGPTFSRRKLSIATTHCNLYVATYGEMYA